MTIIEIAAILAGAAFALLLIQVRKTVAEAEQSFTKMNDELPHLIGQIQAMTQVGVGLSVAEVGGST